MGAYEYQPAAAKRLYVKSSASPGGNGVNWGNAYKYLQDALAAAQLDPYVTEIWVAAGTYQPDRDSAHPSGTRVRSRSFQPITGMAVRGGFVGDELPSYNPADRDFAAHTSILSGDLAGNDGPNFTNNAENSYHVVTTSLVGPEAVLDGFTVSGGNANGSSSNSSGGGVYDPDSSPRLINCTLSGNAAANGGGMYNAFGNPTLTDCTFRGNAASIDAGGMHNLSGTPTLTHCIFSGNSASSGTGGGLLNKGNPTLTNCMFRLNTAAYAGGLASYYDATLTDCVFNGNSASVHGGGMYVYSGSATLTGCTFSANSAASTTGGLISYGNLTLANCIFSVNSAFYGGGLSNYSYATVTDCTFSGNSCSGYNSFGGAVLNHASMTLTNCVFSGNSASSSAGTAGGLLSDSSLTLANSTFSGNTAAYGGGLAIYYNATVTNCTFSGNSSFVSGFGGAVLDDGSLILTNCILWGNGGTQMSGNGAPSAAVTYSCVQGTVWPGTGNISTNPLFVDATAGDLRLQAGSPCIDAGDNAAVPIGILTDLDGHPRFVDDPATHDTGDPGSPPQPVVDMGAYEYQVSIRHADLNCDGVVNFDDINPFVTALVSQATYEARYPGCPWLNADTNGDGSVDFDDINPFVRCLVSSGCP